MVSLNGKIGPFRIDREEFIELITKLEEKLVEASSPTRQINVKFENFEKDCKNVAELREFSKDIFLPKVIKKGTVWIWAKTTIYLSFDDVSANYAIKDAKDTSLARSFEDVIQTYLKKHSMPRIFSAITPIFLSSPLVIALVLLLAVIISSILKGTYLPYRAFFVFGIICIVSFSMYVIWSNYTKDTPSISFIHSILYLEQPKSNVPWAFLSSIIIGLLVSYITTLIG